MGIKSRETDGIGGRKEWGGQMGGQIEGGSEERVRG